MRSFLRGRRHYAGKPVVTSRNVGYFLRHVTQGIYLLGKITVGKKVTFVYFTENLLVVSKAACNNSLYETLSKHASRAGLGIFGSFNRSKLEREKYTWGLFNLLRKLFLECFVPFEFSTKNSVFKLLGETFPWNVLYHMSFQQKILFSNCWGKLFPGMFCTIWVFNEKFCFQTVGKVFPGMFCTIWDLIFFCRIKLIVTVKLW